MKKIIWPKKFLVLFGVFLLCGLLCGLVYLFNVYIPNHPKESLASGDFPVIPVWVYTATEKVISAPIVALDRVYVRTLKGVYALDAGTGNFLWNTISPGKQELDSIYSPMVVENRIVVPESLSNIAVFDIENGKLIWRTDSPKEGSGFKGDQEIYSIIANKDMLFVARQNYKITAYDIKNGEIEWEVDVPQHSFLYLLNGIDSLYLVADKNLYDYEITSGHMIRELNFGCIAGPALRKETMLYMALYTDACPNMLIARHTDESLTYWQIQSWQAENIQIRYMIASEGILYLTGTGIMAVEEKSGKILWISDASGLFEKPVILNDHLFVRNNETDLLMLDIHTGKETGRLLVQADGTSIADPGRYPVVYDDLLIVPFGDQRVIAYRP